MKVRLSNGMEVEGTFEQIRKVAETFGIRNPFPADKYYESETKGLLLISDMETTHLRNAILKQYTTWVDSLHSITNPQVLVRTVINGITDFNFVSMLTEYSKRSEPEPRRRF